jgi:hypothetical protein
MVAAAAAAAAVVVLVLVVLVGLVVVLVVLVGVVVVVVVVAAAVVVVAAAVVVVVVVVVAAAAVVVVVVVVVSRTIEAVLALPRELASCVRPCRATRAISLSFGKQPDLSNKLVLLACSLVVLYVDRQRHRADLLLLLSRLDETPYY